MVSGSVPRKDAEVANIQLNAMAADAAWKTITLTPDVLQAARDAVSYKKNYNRAVTNKFCLYYINSISSRLNSGLINYLVSVDGCESSQVVEGGICDIYYCKPYKYELQLAQKAAGSYEFGVSSVSKTVDQPKSADDIRNEWSNVMPEIPVPEIPAPEGAAPPPPVGEAPPEWEIPYLEPEVPIFGPEGSYLGQDFPVVGQENPVIPPENQNQVSGQENQVIATASPYQNQYENQNQNQYQGTYQSPGFVPAQENPVVVTASPVQWQSPVFMPESPVIMPDMLPQDTEYGEEWSRSGDDEEAVDWAANDMWWDAQPESTEEAPMPEEWTPPQPISLRADAVGQTNAAASGIPAIAAIAGVAAVSMATVVSVLALTVIRSRARANAARRSLNQEKAPLRGTPTTSDVTISMTHEDNNAADTEPSSENGVTL